MNDVTGVAKFSSKCKTLFEEMYQKWCIMCVNYMVCLSVYACVCVCVCVVHSVCMSACFSVNVCRLVSI